jgi:uncharacterized protein (TIGR02145 family)
MKILFSCIVAFSYFSSLAAQPPTVFADSLRGVTSNSAVCWYTVLSVGAPAITERGVCWSTLSGPTITDSKTIDAISEGQLISSISGLSPNTTYYVRPYGSDGAGVVYGNELSFTTSNDSLLSIGQAYQGGIIAYIYQPGDMPYVPGQTKGIIAAPSDQSIGIQWYNGSYIPVNGSFPFLGLGQDNTYAIVSTQSAGSYAASLCWDLVLGGYSDWFLPSIEELNKLYLNRAVIGGFASDNYWSSTNGANDSLAFALGFQNGVQYENNRMFSSYVRAVRAFSVASTPPVVTDIDGNIYNTVTIGAQIWMKENLKTTKYNDGLPIPLVTDSAIWVTLSTPGYCWYNNDSLTYHNTFGILYNWFTVNTGNICPTGWHAPSDAEWKIMEMYIGMTQVEADSSGWRGTDQGIQLKSTTGWNSGGNGTNTSGFDALPAGARVFDGTYVNINNASPWWSTTEYNTDHSWTRELYNIQVNVSRSYTYKSSGFSVRCLKDLAPTTFIPTISTQAVTSITTTTTTTGGDIIDSGGSGLTARGVCWSLNPNPTIADNFTNDGVGVGMYTSQLAGLVSGTTYYVRAYATNSVGTAYGNELSFTTLTDGFVLVANGGFEADTLGSTSAVNWDFSVNPDGSTANLTIVSDAHSGNNALKADVTLSGSAVFNTVNLYKLPGNIIIPKAGTFSLSFWAKASASNQIQVSLERGLWVSQVAGITIPSISTGWQKYSVNFQTTQPDTCLLQIWLQTSGTYWLDDVEITEVVIPPAPTAVIRKASIAPVIDGVIDTVWANANVYNISQPFSTDIPTLGAAGTTTWKGLWTNTGIYLLLQVNDDVFFPAYAGTDSIVNSWNYDRPEIYFDVNQVLADGIGTNNGFGTGHHQVAADFVISQLNGEAVTNGNGVINAFKVTNPSYIAEYYVPFSMLIDKDGTEVPKIATIGFDVNIIDRDVQPTPRQRAVWYNSNAIGPWDNMNGCGTFTLEGVDPGILVTGITVASLGNGTTIETQGGTLQMTASVLPVNATNQAVIWTVTDGTGKASVNATGLLTAISNGTVVVNAKSKDGSYIIGSMVITLSNQLVIVSPAAVIKNTTIAPVVDGVIDTVWANANTYNIAKAFGAETPTLGDTGTTIWKGLWTNEGLYLLINVKDNIVLPAYNGSPYALWMYDHPEIYLDVNQILADGLGASAGLGHFQVAPYLLTGQTNGLPLTDGTGVVNAFLATDSTYVGEYFIPFTKLTDKNGIEVSRNASIGFDITIADNDSVVPVRNRAVWSNTGSINESWFNMDGCGTFTLEQAPAIPITDIDGNTYNTVNIGTQTWMAENLKTTKYRNGDLIGTTIPDTLNVSGEITPKYQWAYMGNESNVPAYGRLYTWDAIMDSRNVCPVSWHVPSDAEWTVLNDYLGGAAVAGGKLKEAGLSHWFAPNTGATNETGFNALPGGIRGISGVFQYGAGYGGWWSSTEIATTSAWYRYTVYNNDSLFRDNYCLKVNGFSVRCIKDTVVSSVLPTILTQNIFNITSNSAVAGSLITSDGGGIISSRGVCWSTSSNPTTANSFTNEGPGIGGFPSNFSGLIPNTLYYVRSYATNSAGTAYGNELSFTTTSFVNGFVLNGGFENDIQGTSNPANWSCFASDGCSSVYSVVADSHTGNNALQANVTLSGTPKVNSVQIQHYPPTIIFNKAGNYTFSFWAKGSSSNQLQAILDRSDWSYVGQIIIPSLTTSWQKYSFNFHLAGPDTCLIQIWLQSNGTYWLDDVEIVEMVPVPAPTAMIRKASIAPVIDGIIDTVWANANTYNIDKPYGSETPTLGAPGSTTWKSLWTNDGLYLLLQVNDNVFVPGYAGTEPWSPWFYDRPEIYFDVNPVLADGLGASNGSGHFQIAPIFVAGQINGTAVTNADGIVNSYLVTNPTYVAEYFIPFTKLIDKNGFEMNKSGTIGFDVTLSDNDVLTPLRNRAVWANTGLINESWNNMNDCGTFTLEGFNAGTLISGITISGTGSATSIDTDNGTLQMVADIVPVNATDQSLTWYVNSVTGKATISSTGVLTAIRNGIVTVTAKSKDGSYISSTAPITLTNQVVTETEAAGMIFSLMGSAFYMGDGITPATWNYDIDLTYSGTVGGVSSYTLNNQLFFTNGEFKIRVDHQWVESYGYTDLTITGDTANFANQAPNIKVLTEKTYNLIFSADWVNNTYTLTMNLLFDGGSGTQADPFLVATADQLNNVRHFNGIINSGVYFRQIADIDLGVAPWNQLAGWQPIGNTTLQFYGNYDGNGFTISNLTINRPAENYMGLFGWAKGAKLNNIGLVNADVTGMSRVGALVGQIRDFGVVSNCYSTGNVKGQMFPAGLVGNLYYNSILTKSYSTANVQMIPGASNQQAGGLVARASFSSSISNCFAAGKVDAVGSYCGGLAGNVTDITTISDCYAIGDVSGDYYVGGLLGSTQVNCVISNCYSTGKVSQINNGGGLSGGMSAAVTNNNYWNTETSGKTLSAFGESKNTLQMLSASSFNTWAFDTTWTILEGSTYPYFQWQTAPGTFNFPPAVIPPSNLLAVPADGSISLTWSAPSFGSPTGYNIYRDSSLIGSSLSVNYTDAGLTNSIIHNYFVTATYNVDESVPSNLLSVFAHGGFTGGDGSPAAPYLISNADELFLTRLYLSSHFKQVANIDLGVSPWNMGEGWLPIGSQTKNFKGAYDGNGYNISNLTINRPSSDMVGLFGRIDSSFITNIIIENASISGGSYGVGILAGEAVTSLFSNISVNGFVSAVAANTNFVGGIIGSTFRLQLENCHSSGTINTTGSIVGGLLGDHTVSSMSNSYSSMIVSSTQNNVGGLCGNAQSSSITNSYFIGSVSGNQWVGGLVGYADSSLITKCYSSGNVVGNLSYGGLLGAIVRNGIADSCYWNTQTSGQLASAGGMGRSTDDMTSPYSPATYQGWDFSGIWAEDASYAVNNGYPYLRTLVISGNAVPNSIICSGSSASVTLTGYSGAIQWQQSADGVTNWVNVIDGAGMNSDNYVTGTLYATTYFRAAVSQPSYSVVYSNWVQITVNPFPAASGTIIGTATVCQGQNSISYKVPAIANSTSYIWSLPNGATGTSVTDSIVVDFGVSAISGIISVKGNNSCGDGISDSLTITVNPLPVAAGTLAGPAIVCQGQSAQVYTVPVIAYATSYVWNLPTGATGTSVTNSIIVDYGISALSGIITVKGSNSCGDGAISTLAVTVNPLPGIAGAITGPTTVCQAQGTAIYSAVPIANAASYVWSFPAGITGTGFGDTITLNIGLAAVSGNLGVKGVNSCGTTLESTLAIIVNLKPATPVVSFDGKILHSDAVEGNQWYDQNGLIYGAASQDYSVTTDGDYYCIVTLNGCSSDKSNTIAKISLCEARFDYIWSNATGFTTFTDLSVGTPSGWSWNFGDGTYSKLKNPVHNYIKDGVYTVTLNTINELTGCISSVTKEVIAISTITCASDFEFYINSVTGLTVFNSTSLNATDYYWDFGDGGFSVDSVTEYTYTKPGIYPVCLNIWNAVTGCQAITCKNIVYLPEGQKYIEADYSFFTSSTDSSVIFSDLSSANTTNWYWTMGDGKVSTLQNPVYTYSKPGLFIVTLTVFDSNTNLSSTITREIRVGAIPCEIAANYTHFINPTTLEVTFFNLSTGVIDNYSWDFGDGTSSTLESPVHMYSEPGYYEAELSVRNSVTKCMDEYSLVIQVGSIDCRAGFDFIVNPVNNSVNFQDASKGQITYYYWDFGNGASSIEQNPQQIYTDPGIYMVGQFVIDNANCVDYMVQPVQVGTIDCSADFISYVDSSIFTAYFTNKNLGDATALLWSFGDGSFSTVDNPVHRFPGAGIYSTGLNTFDFNTGCMDYYEENMMIGSIGIDCSADFIYRVDPATGEVTFINQSIGEISGYIWNFGEVASDNSLVENPVYTYAKAGYYNVCLTVTNSDGIRNMGCKWVLIEGTTGNDCRANFMFTVDSASRKATFVDNSYGEIDKYTWDFGDSKSDSVSLLQNPSHTYANKGYYLVQLKVENSTSGCTSSEYKLLNVADNQVLKAAFGYEAKLPDKKFTGYPVDLVSASSGDGATVEWDFGDKQLKKGSFTIMDSTRRRVTHYYQLPGTYSVCLRISDPVRKISDTYCSFVTTKNAVNVEEVTGSDMELSVYPNPFIDFTTISYSLSKPDFIEIAIFDQLGRKMETLIKSKQESGSYQLTWETKAHATGIYHLKLITENGIITKQLVITR